MFSVYSDQAINSEFESLARSVTQLAYLTMLLIVDLIRIGDSAGHIENKLHGQIC